jgi:hypothetical protein
VTAHVDLPEGLHGYGVILDSVSLDHSGLLGDSLTGRTTLVTSGPDTYSLCSMRWIKNGGITVRGDTLYFRMLDKELKTSNPYRLDISPGGEIQVEQFNLAGSMGRVAADGYMSADSADFDAEIVFHPPRRPGFIEVADRLWPDSLLITADADGPTTFHVGAVVEGIEIAGRTPVRAELDLRSTPDSTSAGAVVISPDRRLFEMRGYLPAYRLGDKLGQGAVVLDVSIDRFPLPASQQALTSDNPEILGWLSGRVAVRGTADDPRAVAALRCEFAPGTTGTELSKYRLNFEGELTGEAAPDGTLAGLKKELFSDGGVPDRSSPGLAASLSMEKSGTSVLKGKLMYPLVVSLAPFSAGTNGNGEVDFSFETAAVALTDLDPLLPPDLDLEGTCAIKFTATGATDNPAIEGSIRTSNAKIISTRGAQISPDINLRLSGTAVRPSVSGDVQIRNGFLRIPEQQSKLLPAEGHSRLWEAADSAAAAAARGGAVAVKDTMEVPAWASELELDIAVEIPGSFRIIGSRMNVELSGDLRLFQKEEKMMLTGQLNALGGQLLFMGRTFELRRGTVNFYGGDELNPSFDLTLVSEVAGYRIEIKLTGTMLKPQIELTSDPQLEESDIMSLLVFGKPMDDLNTSQSGLVQQRTAEILMIYGAVKLQEQMSKELGVDLITVQQSTRKPDESALVVGKYLNSRTLIKYEQNLENTGSYLVNLEYVLTKRIKLETFVDQATETGIEINWSKDY